MIARCVALLFLLLLVVSPAVASETATLTVFAAASLTDAFKAIETAFEDAHPGIDMVFSFGGSSTLAAQILEGAPADVFASANREQMQRLNDAGLLAGQAAVFARNRLVLITPRDNPAGIHTVADLARGGIKLVLAATGVPVRAYTDQMLNAAAAQPEFGADFYTRVLANVVSEEDNVRRVAAKVALGEADAGIVYASDATADLAGQVLVIPIPDALNVVAEYPVAVVARTAHSAEARAFVDFVLSAEAQSVIQQAGLLPAVQDRPVAAHDAALPGRLSARVMREAQRWLSALWPLAAPAGG